MHPQCGGNVIKRKTPLFHNSSHSICHRRIFFCEISKQITRYDNPHGPMFFQFFPQQLHLCPFSGTGKAKKNYIKWFFHNSYLLSYYKQNIRQRRISKFSFLFLHFVFYSYSRITSFPCICFINSSTTETTIRSAVPPSEMVMM